jgi:8-oxo-dGTP diphosphatase
MKTTTLCFLVRKGEVLLGMKKRGFGINKWNGVGGKLIVGETVEQAAIREIKEEIGVDVKESDLHNRGSLVFTFQEQPDWAQECYVFIVEQWSGEPTESEELRPEWHKIEALPFESMWIDDPLWLPLVLQGKNIKGEFVFSKTGAGLIEHSVSIL